jgi:hypothetical protein
MSDLFNRMMEANKLSNKEAIEAREAEIEAKRHEMAGAMTRMMINEALSQVQQTKQDNEALAEKARADKK